MKLIFMQKKVKLSIYYFTIVLALFLALNFLVIRSINDPMTNHIADGVVRSLLAILSAFLLGKIIQSNGFKFSFSFQYMKKTLLASLPILLLIVLAALRLINVVEINFHFEPFSTYIAISLLRDLSSGIFEEVWFRGLLMTATLYYYGNTAKGRLLVVIATSLLFGLGHYGGGLSQIFSTFLGGVVFSAVYVYSMNLLLIGLLHGLMNSLTAMVNIEQIRSIGMAYAVGVANLVLSIAALAFAIIIIVKSEPFSKKLTLKFD